MIGRRACCSSRPETEPRSGARGGSSPREPTAMSGAVAVAATRSSSSAGSPERCSNWTSSGATGRSRRMARRAVAPVRCARRSRTASAPMPAPMFTSRRDPPSWDSRSAARPAAPHAGDDPSKPHTSIRARQVSGWTCDSSPRGMTRTGHGASEASRLETLPSASVTAALPRVPTTMSWAPQPSANLATRRPGSPHTRVPRLVLAAAPRLPQPCALRRLLANVPQGLDHAVRRTATPTSRGVTPRTCVR